MNTVIHDLCCKNENTKSKYKVFKKNKCMFGYIRKDIDESIIEEIKESFDNKFTSINKNINNE